MKIAIISDTHNRVDRVRRALDELRRRGVRTVLHCGDIQNAAVVECFADFDVHFVFGNCDYDQGQLRLTMADIGATLHGRFGRLELCGKKIAFTHGHDYGLLQDLEYSEEYDYLFHGHTHVAVDRQAGPTRVINPGALQRVAVPTFVILDLVSGEAEQIEVPS
jgi:putative phosphoesterase